MTTIRFLLLIPLLLVSQAASAENADGSGALALAALVGIASPVLSADDKDLLMKLLNGTTQTSSSPGETITVSVDELACRASNVDITVHSCALKFGSHDVNIEGRRAHELYATLIEIGVSPDGAAGSIYEAVSTLKCTIDPDEVRENAGGGVNCQYRPLN
jgi:hypothetical protein